jgi:uncharacterized membrane protein
MKNKQKRVALVLAIIILVAAAIAVYVVISAKPSTWQIDTTLSNTGHQDTAAFAMNNTWRIGWIINKENDNLFVLAVYIKNGTTYSWVTEATQTDANNTRGILPVPYTGTFVIRVVASDDTEWTLIIEEFKPA